MIDDRICIYYVADRVQEIRDGEAKIEDFLSELNHNIGVNARWKRNNPDALVADLPPIDAPRTKRKRSK
jgi:hypothetical protein|tara:strand:- start:3748 stop:3954 length:207 start_codon:yes stop_codon:yes gene_type:complete